MRLEKVNLLLMLFDLAWSDSRAEAAFYFLTRFGYSGRGRRFDTCFANSDLSRDRIQKDYAKHRFAHRQSSGLFGFYFPLKSLLK